MRIIRYPELRPLKGIPYSREHLRRLEEEGKFPRRIRFAEGGDFYGWAEEELDAHLAARAAAREAA